VAVKGSLINWTPCFQVSFSTGDDLDYLKGLAKERQKTMGEQLYVQPRVEKGRLQTGYLVSKGEVNLIDLESCDSSVVKSGKAVKITNEDVLAAEKECKNLMAIDISDNVEEEDTMEEEYGDHDEMDEEIRNVEASVSVEADGDASGGCAGQDGDLILEGIKGTRSVLVEGTKTDESLHVAKGLAERRQEGYRYVDGVVIRTRMDRTGDSKDQICLPKPLRNECMRLAHTKFGHMGRNKMCQLIKPYFYWPNLFKDCQLFIKLVMYVNGMIN